MWFVPGLEVWGIANWGRIDYLVAEQVAGSTGILYGNQGLGDDAQSVLFADLTDHRGNKLPDSIEEARILVRSRSADAVYVVGEESAAGFKIARDPAAEGPVTVDLLVVELSL
jgi:DNA transposition AAA+ family ATPase